jgi:hypothetical protein
MNKQDCSCNRRGAGSVTQCFYRLGTSDFFRVTGLSTPPMTRTISRSRGSLRAANGRPITSRTVPLVEIIGGML